MQIDENIIRAKEAVVDELLNRPGVSGVDVGFKYVGGQRTDEVVIRVFVTEKKDVPEAELIPQTIGGIPTDVLQCNPQLLSNFYDPIQGGATIANYNDSLNGTAGMVVFDRVQGLPMLLTNRHVVENFDGTFNPGVFVYQPPIPDIPVPDTRLGSIDRGLFNGVIDAALVSLNWRGVSGQILGIGPINGIMRATLGMRVRKYGATTKLTAGTVTGIAASVQVEKNKKPFPFNGQVTIQGDSMTPWSFAAPGDSGSIIVDDAGRATALLFAGDSGMTIANHITDVLNLLDAEVYNPDTEPVGFFRCYNHGNADHLYTTDWREVASVSTGGFAYERMQCAVYRLPHPGTVALHRYFNHAHNDHFYTTNFGELGSGGGDWQYNGVAAYVFATEQTGTVPLHRYLTKDGCHHFYTTDFSEIGSGNADWTYEGKQCWVFPRPVPHVSKPSKGPDAF